MKAKNQQDEGVLEEDLAKTKSQLVYRDVINQDYFPKWQELKLLGKNNLEDLILLVQYGIISNKRKYNKYLCIWWI
ncbi:unnamed protein product [Paramecium sonneborni]|uniref:Uncharacterized protein n=1 Tax=Paramecium sonneborni TaxID=65129 RepID=A0A8S1KYP2_9CILI|nr:unnamed protein product [Paramecium sonneborni]